MSDLKTGNVVYHRGLLKRWPLKDNPEFKIEAMSDDKKYSTLSVFTDGVEPFSGRSKRWTNIPTEKLLKVDDFKEEDSTYEETKI